MLRRILVLLADTRSSAAARKYAFRLAGRTQAELAGLAGVDLTSIDVRMPGRIGTSAYLQQMERSLKQEAEDSRQRMHEVFEAECREHNVPFEWLSFEGDPVDAVGLAVEARDLIVTGRDTAFCGDAQEPVSQLLGKLLTISPRPIIVCPDELPAGNEVVLAYDGSVPAMRATQMFVLLGIGRDRPVCVTSIDPAQETAARRCAGAAAYLCCHGYHVTVNPIASRVHPSEVLRSEISERKIDTLVMGAYGHRGIRELFFGSTTSALAESAPCALFLYH